MALSTSPKNVAFDLSNQLIEKLLSQFENKGFSKLVKTESKAVPYALPDIVLSKEDVKVRDCEFGIVEKLGSYKIKDWDSSEEGVIIIYYETIWNTAREYHAANTSVTSSKEDCFKALTCIVTLHELVHWLMHYVIGFVPLAYTEQNEKEFHEGFAELFTRIIIRDMQGEDDKLIRQLFLWLEKDQTRPEYLAFRKFKKVNSDELIGFEEGIELLKFCKATRTQKMDVIKPYLKLKSLNDGSLELDDLDVPYWCQFFIRISEFRNTIQTEFEWIYKRLPEEKKILYKGKYELGRFGL